MAQEVPLQTQERSRLQSSCNVGRLTIAVSEAVLVIHFTAELCCRDLISVLQTPWPAEVKRQHEHLASYCLHQDSKGQWRSAVPSVSWSRRLTCLGAAVCTV